MFAVLGIILIVAGAILTFAVERTADGVDIVAIGWILMAGGAVALIVAAIRGAAWQSRTNSKMHVERHATPDGQHYVEDVRTD